MTLATVNVISERRRAIPRPTRPPQPWMKIHKRLNRNVRRTDLHPCTSRRVKHPCRHDNRSARFSFDDDDVSAGALLTVIAPHRTFRRVHATCSESLLLARYGQNNPAIALGRKNHLFAGSDGGGEQWAIVLGSYFQPLFADSQQRSRPRPARHVAACRRRQMLILRAKVEAMGCARQRAGEAMVLRR